MIWQACAYAQMTVKQSRGDTFSKYYPYPPLGYDENTG
jgi:hypothetical protein